MPPGVWTVTRGRRTALVAFAGTGLLIAVAWIVSRQPGPAEPPESVAPSRVVEPVPRGEPPPRDSARDSGSGDDAAPAWTVADIDAVDPLLVPVYKETVEDAVLMSLPEGMGAWSVGDRIVIPVPQLDAVYTPVIDGVETALGINRSYVGRLTDGEFPYSFVITVGERNTFAHLGTPQGTYELVGNTRLAWLMPTANMDQHVDYSKPDYFIPEEPGRPRLEGRRE